jgi:hypothetical protein
VHWYDRERVFLDAAAALGREEVDAFLQAMGRPIGPPWQAKHKLAAAAALAATGWGAPGRPPENKPFLLTRPSPRSRPRR